MSIRSEGPELAVSLMNQAKDPQSNEAAGIREDSESAAIRWFREASPYINAHRGKTIVFSLPGEVLQSALLPTLCHDLTLLSHLGLRLVLCFGLRVQVEDSLKVRGGESDIVDGRRITDGETLKTIISEAGIARNELEARLSMVLPNTPMAGARLSVASGNYVTAQPFGIHNGVDFQHTGSVREVHGAALNALLDAGNVVLLPPLGFSLTGDVFNITVNEVACECARELDADKLVFFVDQLPVDPQGEDIRQASASDVERLACLSPFDNGTHLDKEDDSASRARNETFQQAVNACRQGIERVHLLRHDDPDALLRELFSRDGSGTLITRERWEHIRTANNRDVFGIIELIEPLQADGTLAPRSREQLELDLEHFVVSERDGTVVACGALFTDDKQAEIACLATHQAYRGEGRADQILQLLEDKAKRAGCDSVRLLSTRTGHWFVERGFSEVSPDALPDTRRESYNHQRNSKVYVKPL